MVDLSIAMLNYQRVNHPAIGIPAAIYGFQEAIDRSDGPDGADAQAAGRCQKGPADRAMDVIPGISKELGVGVHYFQHFFWGKHTKMGLSEKWLVPLHPMVLLIISPTKNGYFIGGIPHFQTYPYD